MYKAVSILVLLLLTSQPAQAEEGYATWYSVGSCLREGTSGVRTASGEAYRDDGRTCAHPTLPFGTRLRVQYQGKSVVCRVNDRGPGRGPRKRGVVLDLTPLLFSELAPLSRGKLLVQVDPDS